MTPGCALRARLKRAEQALDMVKKALLSTGWTAARAKSSALVPPGRHVGPARDHAQSPGQRGPAPCPGPAPPPAGLIVHSDRGRQSTATCFQQLLTRHGAQQRRSRRGNGDDNAPAESFGRRCNAQLPDGGRFPGLAEATRDISHHTPLTTPNAATPPWDTAPPTASKLHLKPRPTSVRLR